MARFAVFLSLSLGLLLAAEDASRAGAEAMRAGRFAEAEQIYRKLVREQPREAGWHGNLGPSALPLRRR
jgi:hypothetical protein